MSFKDEYKKSYDNIVPDQKFIDRLSAKLEQEQQKRRRGNYGIPAILAGVLVLLVVSLTAFHIITGNSEPSRPVQVNTGSTLQTPSAEIGTFSTPKWYGEEDQPGKILSDFAKRLRDKKQLQELYCSNENNFTDETCVSGKERKQLEEKIASGSFLSEEQRNAEQSTYYMAQFENGDIIKFVVLDDRYLKFLDLEYLYELGK